MNGLDRDLAGDAEIGPRFAHEAAAVSELHPLKNVAGVGLPATTEVGSSSDGPPCPFYQDQFNRKDAEAPQRLRSFSLPSPGEIDELVPRFVPRIAMASAPSAWASLVMSDDGDGEPGR